MPYKQILTTNDIGTEANQIAAGNHNHDSSYVKKSGDTMTGLLNAHGGISLNSSTVESTGLTYVLGIKGFADGGNIVWSSAGNVSVGAANKLNSSAGSTGQAIYFTGGQPAAIDWRIGNNRTGEHNANNVTYNFCGYYNSNGPANIGNTTTDGALYAQAYSSSWVGQIAQDYRNGNLFTRGKNNDSWTSWKEVMIADLSSSTLTDCNNVSNTGVWTSGSFTNRPGAVADWGSLFNIKLYDSNNNYHRQLFFDCYDTDKIWTRSDNGGTWTSWKQVWVEGNAVTGAVWNDYAECRESDCEEFGYVLMETGDDSLTKTTERLSHFAGVSSDTWGFSQGKTERARTPIAVAGRVLVYPYQDRNNYKPGDCVCAAPGGTVDIMTREEVREWPDRIVGTVSCVPNYEEWGGGESADRSPIKVDGRIWIKVK